METPWKKSQDKIGGRAGRKMSNKFESRKPDSILVSNVEVGGDRCAKNS